MTCLFFMSFCTYISLQVPQLSSTRMGKIFGNLIYAKNIITYSLSPYEQSTFRGMFRKGIPNVIRKFSEEIFYILPGMTTAFLVYHYGTKDFHRRMRKNPADYENEE